MPFANARRAIALLLGQAADCQSIGCDQRPFPDVNDSSLQPASPMVAAGEKSIARGGAAAGGTMSIGEANALLGEAVDIRRADLTVRGVIALDIAVAEIV